MVLKKITRTLLPSWLYALISYLRAKIFDSYAIKSYSQEGEDMILRRLFGGHERGFYVDVGAHHPNRFSNTNYFYRRGWRGVNIEPNPDAIRIFQLARRRDINLRLGVSDRAGTLSYYQFDEPALNTFDSEMVKSRIATTPFKLLGKIDVPVDRLSNILKKYLPSHVDIDFLSIDVEGLDLMVLKSNDWSLFRPKYVLVESLGTSLEDVMNSEMFMFMKSKGYEVSAKTFNTLIFSDKSIGH